MSTAASQPAKQQGARARAAFTLIELILVMALLAIVAGVAAPRMAAFFRGRTLDVEARRILALTHYGQSRAVSEGQPVILWFDPSNGTYGLTVQAGYVDQDDLALEYTVDPEIKLEIEPVDAAVSAEYEEESWGLPQDRLVIRFTPEGFIDVFSVHSVVLRHTDQSVLAVAQKPNRLGYEIIHPDVTN